MHIKAQIRGGVANLNALSFLGNCVEHSKISAILKLSSHECFKGDLKAVALGKLGHVFAMYSSYTYVTTFSSVGTLVHVS
jgi:hypothetical protein